VQRNKLHEKLGKMIDAAGADGVNVMCLQEAWSKHINYLKEIF
jgi:hypothetical protein